MPNTPVSSGNTDSILYETVRLLYEPRFMEMCKKYMTHISNWSYERNKEEPTFENLRMKGMDAFDEKEIFRLCSKRIREDNYEEDDFLLYLCFELFKRQQYDKVILTYLANFYCGATRDMKKLWETAKEYGVLVVKLGERIITQMIFSEDMFGEEEIFLDYYLNGNPYFRLKQAYLAYASREYMVNGRINGESVFEIIINEYKLKEELADICKIAVLRYYSDREYDDETGELLHQVLQEMCEKQIVFPFYLEYDEAWLRETQLYDKVMVEYRASKGGKVRIFYKMKNGESEELDYRSEGLTPMYENIYVKTFMLYKNEGIRYYFQETQENKIITQEERLLEQKRRIPSIGRFGKLNAMSEMGAAERKKAMMDYQQELLMAERIFQEF